MGILNRNYTLKAALITAALALFTAAPGAAQISVTLQDGGYFYVVVAGDTVSQHVRLDKAIESGSEFESFEVVQDFRLSGSSYFYDETIIVEEIVDTVWVRDVVTADPPLYDFLSVGVETLTDTTGHIFLVTAQTAADSSKFLFDCNDRPVWVWNGSVNKRTVHTEYPTVCTGDASVTARFYHDGDSTDVVETFPFWTLAEGEATPTGYLTAFDNWNPDKWVPTWGALTYGREPGTLILSLPSRSIARLEWRTVPEHKNIRYRIIETPDSSHSTGAHIGGRHGPDAANKNSVETYLNSEGIGVSIFSNGTWTNPVNFPVDWQFGERIEYTVEIVDDTITIYIADEVFTYSSETIGAVPPGRFALGSTGAGMYFIHEIEVQILD